MEKQNHIQNKILDFAKSDERIRSVILNGSRTNSNVIPDQYQDFDIVFIVNNFNSFLHDRHWITVLGKPILQQLPDEMELGKDPHVETISFAFLMIFEGGYRIDLTLFPYEKYETHFKRDSLTLVWLDKDDLFKNIAQPSDKDYHITKPSQQEFTEVCNEFWWCVTNVAKGLKRKEVIYAKDMLENVVRPMFWKLIEWNVGHQHHFKVSLGKSGKFAKKFMSQSLYEDVLNTYSNADINSNWDALERMLKIFAEEQGKFAKELNFKINTKEIENSTEYIRNMRLA